MRAFFFAAAARPRPFTRTLSKFGVLVQINLKTLLTPFFSTAIS